MTLSTFYLCFSQFGACLTPFMCGGLSATPAYSPAIQNASL